MYSNRYARITVIVASMAAIMALHLTTRETIPTHHAIHRELFLLPLVLAGLWFGLRGVLGTLAGIFLLYGPFVAVHWGESSVVDVEQLLALALFVLIGVILDYLIDRERKHIARLRESERLAAMGQATAAIVHEVKTPLIAIGGLSRLLRDRRLANDADRPVLDLIVGQVDRLEKLLGDTLQFARPLELCPEPVDLAGLVCSCCTLAEGIAAAKRVSVKAAPAVDIGPIIVDRARMEQALANLLANAVQASPEEGAIHVTATRTGHSVAVTIRDEGPGISPEVRNRLFTPFVTTKKNGTGLGLAITRQIVEAHRGHVEIVDGANTGTTFRIILPVR